MASLANKRRFTRDKEYDNGTKALKGVSMQIDDGDFVFLVGPSGSGKSTIIKLITGEIAPTKGQLMVNGYNLNDISPRGRSRCCAGPSA